MKILYIPGAYPFCYYYRGLLPGVYSNQEVIQDFMRRDGQFNGQKALEKARNVDVIVFQRPSTTPSLTLAKSLKLLGKKIIFENDDTYSGIPLERLENAKQIEIAKEQKKNLDEFLKISDGAIVSTDFLKEEYGKIQPNITTLKNCIDPIDAIKCKKNETGKFRIGFIGSVTSNDDYLHIKQQLKELSDRDDITIVIMGVKYQDGTTIPAMKEDLDFWMSLKNVEWHTVVHVTEYMGYISRLALDLAVIPRKEHYFNQCKSNLKFLEMSLLGIPVLAQGFKDGTSPYQGIDKEYMTIVTDNSTWFDEVIKIKDNYPQYLALAQKAKNYVLTNYNIKTYALKWTEAITKLCK